MSSPFALTVCLIFVVLALWHIYMALAPGSGEAGAVPSVEGKPLFVPSRRATAAVGVVLLLFSGLVAATAGIVSVGLPQVALSWLSYALAVGLLARAVGEFRYIGFFKRVRGTKFATRDTFVYSPLCLLLAARGARCLAQWHLTYVGAGCDARVVPRHARRKTVCARGADQSASAAQLHR